MTARWVPASASAGWVASFPANPDHPVSRGVVSAGEVDPHGNGHISLVGLCTGPTWRVLLTVGGPPSPELVARVVRDFAEKTGLDVRADAPPFVP